MYFIHAFVFFLSKLLLYFSFIYILDFLIKLWFHCILVSFVPILHSMDSMVNYEHVRSAQGVVTKIEEPIEGYEA